MGNPLISNKLIFFRISTTKIVDEICTAKSLDLWLIPVMAFVLGEKEKEKNEDTFDDLFDTHKLVTDLLKY